VLGWSSDLNSASDLSSALQYLIQNNVSGFNEIISQLPTKYEALIKVEFIIGPSMFGSITLIVISGICTNFLYPKYKLRTYMISTNMPKEINKKIIDLGFQNEIASWDTTNRSRGNYLHRTMFMLSMPVMQWSSIQGELFMIDPYIKITILRTKAVVGLFKYEPVQNSERQEVMEQVTNDENEIEKIKQVAIVKFKHQMDSVSEKRTRLYEDIKAGGERQKRAEREIKKITKKRNEMITKFKQNIHDIKNMSNDGTNEIPNLPNDKKTKK
jgi:cytochrome c556